MACSLLKQVSYVFTDKHFTNGRSIFPNILCACVDNLKSLL